MRSVTGARAAEPVPTLYLRSYFPLFFTSNCTTGKKHPILLPCFFFISVLNANITQQGTGSLRQHPDTRTRPLGKPSRRRLIHQRGRGQHLDLRKTHYPQNPAQPNPVMGWVLGSRVEPMGFLWGSNGLQTVQIRQVLAFV